MNQSQLLIIGNVNVDFIIGPLASWPEIGTETVLPMSDLRPGGSAGNTAFALKGIGQSFRLVSAVGSDRTGTWLARAFGKTAENWPTIDAPTTVSIGIVHEGSERTFLTTHGHLENYTIDHILPALNKIPEHSGIALLSGVFLSPLLKDQYTTLIKNLRRMGYSLAIDPGWPSEGWSDGLRNEVFDWFGQCDHILINDKEAAALSGEDTVEAAVRVLSSLLPDRCTVVIKNGPNGALACKEGNSLVLPAPAVDPFDTIGAGDCFNAGYLHQISNGKDWKTAVKAGIQTASAAITSFPRQYPDTDTIQKLIGLTESK